MRYVVDDILIPIRNNSQEMMYTCTSLKNLRKVRVVRYLSENEKLTLAELEIIEEPFDKIYADNSGCVTSMAKKDTIKEYGIGDKIIADTKYFLPGLSTIRFGPRKLDWRIKLIMVAQITNTNLNINI